MKLRVYHRSDGKYVIQRKGPTSWYTVNRQGNKSFVENHHMSFLDKKVAIDMCKLIAKEASTLGTVVFEMDSDA